MKCPKCGTINEDNWPITIGGKIEHGGCQECWEDESDSAWWDAVESLDAIYTEQNCPVCNGADLRSMPTKGD